MHEALAQQLLEERNKDEALNYEFNEKFTKLAIE